MKILYKNKFKKVFKKLPSHLQSKFFERLDVFLLNPNNPVLNNHPLKGELKDVRSINITADFRALYQYKIDTVIFVMIGSHSDLY